MIAYLTCWSRTWTLCVNLGLFDSGRQAERRSHTTGGHPTATPERGCVIPWRIAGGLPAAMLAYGRVVQDAAAFEKLTGQLAHFTGRPWTCERVPRSRWIRIVQAPPLPETPAAPPATLSPWLLPVGDGRAGPVWWDVTTAYHLLVAARTGWRKTAFARWLAGYAHASGCWLVEVIDPETHSPAEIGATLRLVAELFDQAEIGADHRVRVLLIIDELPVVLRVPPRTAVDYDLRRDNAHLVEQFLQRGGKRGIHILGLTTDPRVATLGGVRSSFGARLAGWLDDAEYPLVLNRPVPYPQQGPPARGWWLGPGGAPVEVQVHTRPAARAPAEPDGPATTTAHRKIPAIGGRKWR